MMKVTTARARLPYPPSLLIPAAHALFTQREQWGPHCCPTACSTIPRSTPLSFSGDGDHKQGAAHRLNAGRGGREWGYQRGLAGIASPKGRAMRGAQLGARWSTSARCAARRRRLRRPGLRQAMNSWCAMFEERRKLLRTRGPPLGSKRTKHGRLRVSGARRSSGDARGGGARPARAANGDQRLGARLVSAPVQRMIAIVSLTGRAMRKAMNSWRPLGSQWARKRSAMALRKRGSRRAERVARARRPRQMGRRSRPCRPRGARCARRSTAGAARRRARCCGARGWRYRRRARVSAPQQVGRRCSAARADGEGDDRARPPARPPPLIPLPMLSSPQLEQQALVRSPPLTHRTDRTPCRRRR